MTARLHLALAAFFACAAVVALLLIVAYTVGLFGPMSPWLLSVSTTLSLGSLMLQASEGHLAKARGEAGR